MEDVPKSCFSLLSALKALDASTKSKPSELKEDWMSFVMVWTIASQPDWRKPATSRMSCLITDSTVAFPMSLLQTSPIPIGLTPEFLSRAMSLQATKAETQVGST